MLIERLLRDKDGTEVRMSGGKIYHFKPRADGAHVAFVDDEEHAKRLLSITEGYRRAEEVAPGVNASAADQTLSSANAGAQESNIVAVPVLATPTTPEAALELLVRLEAIDPELAAMTAWPHLFPTAPFGDATPPADQDQGSNEPGAAPPEAEISDEALRAEFEKFVGRKPSPRAGRDTMIAQIEAAKRGE